MFLSRRTLPAVVFLLTVTAVSSAQWTQIPGPDAGAVAAIASHGGYLFTGVQGHGVFRSSDLGRSWSLCAGTAGGSIMTLCVADSFIFASGFFDGGGGMRRSSDAGASWQATTGAQSRIRQVASGHGRSYCAGATAGLCMSGDLGVTWEPVASFPDEHAYGVYADDSVVLASTGSMLYRSTDSCRTWEYGGLGGTMLKLYQAESYLYACSQDSGLWRSSDAGAHWEARSFNLPGSGIHRVDQEGDTLFATLFTGIVYQLRGDTVWRSYGADPRPNTVTGSARQGATSFVLLSDANVEGGVFGVFASGDGGRWEGRMSGISCARILRSVTAGGALFAATSHGLFSTTDAGVAWRRDSGALAFAVLYDVQQGAGRLYACTDRGLYHSEDGGARWALTALGDQDVRCLYAKGGLLVAGTNDWMQRSTDGGATWTKHAVNPSLRTPILSILENKGRLFAGAYSNGSLYRSDDAGETWTTLGGGNGVWLLAGDEERIFTYGRDQGLRCSTDGGETWSTGALPPGGSAVADLLLHKRVLFLARRDAVYQRSVDSAQWIALQGMPGPEAITSVRAEGHVLSVNTAEHGIWTHALDGIVGLCEGTSPSPAAATLHAVSPQPCDVACAVTISLRAPSAASLEIVDLLGRSRGVLDLGMLDAGVRNITVDTGALPAGQYLLVLRAAGAIAVRRLLVARGQA